MTFMNYAPFDVDQFLNEALRSTKQPAAAWTPTCDTYEDEQGFWTQVALPGLDRNDINIEFEDGVLTVKGERKEAASKRTYFVREAGTGAFSRSFRLPGNVDGTKVTATYKEGLLTIHIPKREETKPRRIVIG